MLVLAFDTATDLATTALLDDGRLLGERVGSRAGLLEDVHALLEAPARTQDDVDALVVGTGPGSFTSTRIGLAVARGLGLALDVPAAGISTLAALGSQPGVFPVVDARRREVFVEGPRAVTRTISTFAPRTLCVGERRRPLPRDVRADGRRGSPRRRRAARATCAPARGTGARFGPVDAIEPLYVRLPDAEASLA